MVEISEEIKTRVDELNKLPEVMKEWRFTEGVKVVLIKGPATVDEKHPDRISMELKFAVVGPDQKVVGFEPSDYITTFGARAMQKFRAFFYQHVGDVASDIAKKVVEFQEERGRIKEMYGISKEETTTVRSPIVHRGAEATAP